MLLLFCTPLLADSYYTSKVDDPKAVYLTADKFSVHADGKSDDSDALQKAINNVQETHVQGILFVPSGRYRISKTIYIWPGIRVIGFGPTRPVLVLAPNTPGYQQGPAYMVFFAGGRPSFDRMAHEKTRYHATRCQSGNLLFRNEQHRSGNPGW